jgi:hypothetical protein
MMELNLQPEHDDFRDRVSDAVLCKLVQFSHRDQITLFSAQADEIAVAVIAVMVDTVRTDVANLCNDVVWLADTFGDAGNMSHASVCRVSKAFALAMRKRYGTDITGKEQ